MRLLAWVALAAIGTGCRIVVDLAEFDRMQSELGVRSVLRGEGYTLWSPQDWVSSKDWYLLVGEEITASQRALGLARERAPYVQVLLREVEGMQVVEMAAGAGGVSYSGVDRPHPLNGVSGWSKRDQIVVPIAPARVLVLEDGREITGSMAAEHYRSVVRHELAHVFLSGRGLPEDDWFAEGAADLLESLDDEDGVLVDAGAPREALDAVVGLGLVERPLADLLDWREDAMAIAEGRETVDAAGRVLCGLYLRWRIGLTGDGEAPTDLLPRLEAVARLTRAEHLAGEAAWHAWLAEQAPEPVPGEGP